MATEIKKAGRAVALLALPALAAASCQPAAGGGRGGSLSVAARTEQWSFAGLPGTELLTRHYRIFTTTDNHSLLRALPGFLENAHRHYLVLTGLPRPARRAPTMPVYLLGNRQQWAVMTKRVTGPNSRTYLKIDSGGYCYRGVCVLWDLGHFATFSVAAHEGFHQFCWQRLADPLPAWAEEALAVLAEGFSITTTAVTFTPGQNTLRQSDLRRAIAGRGWLPLEKLLSTDAADYAGGPPDYYGHLWALMMFIRSDKQYRAGLERMIADAAAGRLRRELRIPPEMGTGRSYSRSVAVPLFEHYIEPDLAGFETRFRRFARALAKLDQ